MNVLKIATSVFIHLTAAKIHLFLLLIKENAVIIVQSAGNPVYAATESLNRLTENQNTTSILVILSRILM
jgi:hypothetical protein